MSFQVVIGLKLFTAVLTLEVAIFRMGKVVAFPVTSVRLRFAAYFTNKRQIDVGIVPRVDNILFAFN